MITNLNYFKKIYVIILIILLFDPSSCITVDYDTCEKVNFTTIYPIVIKPKIRYYLFTPDNLSEGTELKEQDVISLEMSKFNIDWPIRFFISGWKTTPQNCKTALVKDAYLKLGNYNFILVDWSDWNKREYALAAASVNGVGRLLGNFTKFLNKNYNIEFNDIYLIGHSLGAHVAGAAGQSIKPDKFNTIYGLDPSGPGFVGLLPSYRLDPSDATYVEIISTDVYFFGYGSRTPIGHSVFYPNNGRRIQPFCPQNFTLNINDQFCSHAAAVDYFANSLNPEIEFCGISTSWNDVLLSRKPKDENDDSCDIVMGGEPSIQKTGHYFVPVSKTGPLPPLI